MKGFELKDFTEALRVGLRRFPGAINSKGLKGCRNLVPTEQGLEPYEPLVDINGSGVFGVFYFLVYTDTSAFSYVNDEMVYSLTPIPEVV